MRAPDLNPQGRIDGLTWPCVPAARGRICPRGAKEGWGQMERKGTLEKEGARRRERGLTRCGGEPLEGGTGTMRQGEHLEGKAAHMPARYPLIENRASYK